MYREVTMIELKEVLRLWGEGLLSLTVAPLKRAQLSPGTFRNFAREFSPFMRRGRRRERAVDRPQGSARLLRRADCSGSHLAEARAQLLVIGLTGYHAAASLDGHVAHATDRLASCRPQKLRATGFLPSLGHNGDCVAHHRGPTCYPRTDRVRLLRV
jgi:hypothetical protein